MKDLGGHLKWWAMKDAPFPTFALACKHLPVQATWASSKRIFSEAGNTITAKCVRLNYVKLRDLVLLYECEKYGLW